MTDKEVAVEPKKLKLYLAGRMRGVKFFNYPAFDAARDSLAQHYDIVSPADLDRQSGLDVFKLPEDYDWWRAPPGFDLNEAFLRNVRELLTCDGIVLLPGWQRSRGTLSELFQARAAGLAVYEYQGDGKIRKATLVEPRVRLL